MKTRMCRSAAALAAALLTLSAAVFGQKTELRRIGTTVTYVTGSSLYLGAGSRDGLAAGDTLCLARASRSVGVAVISAVSSSSSSASMISQVGPPAPGDSAFVTKEATLEETAPPRQADPLPRPSRQAAGDAGPNLVTGRFALQYGMAGVVGARPDYAAPGAVLRLDLARLLGTGLTLSFHGRTSYDLEHRSSFPSPESPLKWRVYELSLASEDPGSWYGYAMGRLMSRYVGGLGLVDGAQAFVRAGGLTLGALGGLQPSYTRSTIDRDRQKFAGFANYRWGGGVFSRSDITLAYGQEMLRGKLDRDFVYVQTSLRFGSDFFLYQSTELDLHGIEKSVRRSRLGFTNSFVTMTYAPASWLTLNGGYDATRTVYLFETMKSVSDTLLDRSLKEGFRASVGFRLPMNITLGASGSLRLMSASKPSAHSLGGTVRMSDIGGSGIQLGGGYSLIQGLYTTGNDITGDLDVWISQRFSAALRFDHYRYTVTGEESQLRTITASATLSYVFTQYLYAMLNVDRVWDSVQNAQRVFLEIGAHF